MNESKNDISIQLTLSVDQTNLVLTALSKLPFEAVAGLIGVVTSQADTQIKTYNTLNTTKEPEDVKRTDTGSTVS